MSCCRPRGGGVLPPLDVVVFGGIITAFAFNGYEAGKTFFVVPVLAALTVSGIPVVRRLAWIAIAAAIAWLVFDQRPMNTEGALQSIPRDARAFARGVLAFAKSYVVDWDIDFPEPALALWWPSSRSAVTGSSGRRSS